MKRAVLAAINLISRLGFRLQASAERAEVLAHGGLLANTQQLARCNTHTYRGIGVVGYVVGPTVVFGVTGVTGRHVLSVLLNLG